LKLGVSESVFFNRIQTRFLRGYGLEFSDQVGNRITISDEKKEKKRKKKKKKGNLVEMLYA
jgi:hypothetical protein